MVALQAPPLFQPALDWRINIRKDERSQTAPYPQPPNGMLKRNRAAHA